MIVVKLPSGAVVVCGSLAASEVLEEVAKFVLVVVFGVASACGSVLEPLSALPSARRNKCTEAIAGSGLVMATPQALAITVTKPKATTALKATNGCFR